MLERDCSFRSGQLQPVRRKEMMRVVHEEHVFSDVFVAYLLARNSWIQEEIFLPSPPKNP